MDRPRENHRQKGRATGIVFSVAVLWLALACVGCHDRWGKYQWHTSSTAWGLPQSGRLDQAAGAFDLLFHTAEEKDPWIVVDMLAPREVKAVTLEERVDCCQDRGLPMVIELAGDDKVYAEVARRTVAFDIWEATFPPRKARYLRIRSEGTTAIHLRGIEIP